MTNPHLAAPVPSGRHHSPAQAREHAHELVRCLAERGLRASAAPNVGSPVGAMAVSAQRVDLHPYVGRLVLLLPGPAGTDGLLWHWQRLFPERQWIGARWFQAFCPATKPQEAADAVAGAIDLDVRHRARSAHLGTESGRSDAEFVRQLIIRLGQPLHVLVHRILELLDSVEREVEDTLLFHELLKIDHLTTRVLRGLERQAPLGGETARQVKEPLSLATVMRQAVAQIEHYRRARVQVPPPHMEAVLPGSAGPEIALLLAELVENATKFSPPDTQVQMTVAPAPSGMSIEITDRGLSMLPNTFATLNRLLADPDTVSLRDQIIAGRIGLLIVSVLAQTHGVRVELHPADPKGTRALVTLPAALLMTPQPTPGRPTLARTTSTGTHLDHAAALPPLAPPSPAPPAQLEAAISSPTAPLSTTGNTALGGAGDVQARPALPRRHRKARLEEPAADAAAGHLTTRATGPSRERDSPPKRGPATGLLTDFAGAARPHYQAGDQGKQEPGRSTPPSPQHADPPTDPAAGHSPQ
ncbi:ATP-binding protein [Actinomadura sp. NPDC023710]|uniref:sensor histidine kinase n=1 Tax=Actinomadura sp. NPDC023710 TaxID=3158219 RepID=UPI0033DDD66F